MERPVEVLADLLEDVGRDLREADLALARLGEAAWIMASRGWRKIRGGRIETNGKLKHLKVPGDVSMLRSVLETMAAFLSTTNSKPSALMSLTTPPVSSSSSGSRGAGASPLPTIPSSGLGRLLPL